MTEYRKEEENNRKQQEVNADQSSVIGPIAAGLGVIGLGAIILNSSLSKGSVIANLLHFMGHGRTLGVTVDSALNVAGNYIKASKPGLRSILDAAINAKNSSLVLEPVDIIKDLHSTIEVIGSKSPVADVIKTKVIEAINRRNSNFGNTVGFFSNKLQRITFGEVIRDDQTWKNLIGENSWNTIYKASQEGIITEGQILDKNIYKTIDGGHLRDLRYKATFGKALSKIDLFGQASVLKSIAGEDRIFAVLAPNKGFTGNRYFVDGDILGFTRNKEGVVKSKTLATNRALRLNGDPLSVVTAARQSELETVVTRVEEAISNDPNLTRSKAYAQAGITSLEAKLGISRKFANRDTIWERFITAPFKRAKAISSGEGVIFRHPFKYEGSASPLAQSVLGSSIPEILIPGKVALPVTGGGAAIDYATLSPMQRLKVIFGLEPDVSVIKKEPFDAYSATASLPPNRRHILANKDLVVPHHTGGIKSVHREFRVDPKVTDTHKITLTAAGDTTFKVRSNYYDVGKGFKDRALDTSNYLFYRLNSLASESVFGLGFLPGKTAVGSAARLAAIPIAYSFLKEKIGELDSLSESAFGFSPIKTAASIFATLRIGQQKFREAIGLQQGFDSLETNFPGSVDSGLSLVARTAVAPLAAFAAMAKTAGSIKMAGMAAAAVAAIIGGAQPGQKAAELEEEYAGTRKVPTRKGAYWFLGFSPFEGGQVTNYDYSWYHKLQTDYRTKSIYGSRENYYATNSNVFGIPAPGISNLLGIRNLLNPYSVEERNYNDRPYPIMGGDMFDEFPLIGPLLSSTVGSLIKPQIKRQDQLPLLKANLVDRGLNPSTARLLGIPDINASEIQVENPNSISNNMRALANVATEPLGVYKFALEYMGVKFDDSTTTMLASSKNIASMGREFYGTELGGLGTEFIRRFLISDYSTVANMSKKVNAIPNTSPSWLPGSRSEFPMDRASGIDFSLGDPYTLIDNAEARLPGRGYEALSPLHSGVEGEYDIVDRFLILADVAPTSQAYKAYEAKLANMKLSEDWQKKVDRAKTQREDVLAYKTKYPRYEDELRALNTSTKKGNDTLNNQRSEFYASLRKGWDFITHDVLEEIPLLGSKLAPFRNTEEEYYKQRVLGMDFPTWFSPWEKIAKPGLADIAASNPLTAFMKGSVLAAAYSSPALKFLNPLLPAHAPEGSLINRTSALVAGIAGSALSVARTAAYGTGPYIPEYTKRESEAITYFDNLKYLKYRTYEEGARQEGQPEVAGQYRALARSTTIGAKNAFDVRASLPTATDKRFFDYFYNTPTADRNRIKSFLPDYYKTALDKAWGDSSSSDNQVFDYFSNNPLPSEDFYGWHPSVPSSAANIKLLSVGFNGVGDNLQRFGFYEQHANELKWRIPSLAEQSVTYTMPGNFSSFNELIKAKYASLKNRYSSDGSLTAKDRSTAFRSNLDYSYSVDRSKDTTMYLQDAMR